VCRFQGVHVGYIIAEDADVVDVKQLRYSFVDAEPKKALELFAIQDDVDTNRGIITVGGDLTDGWGLYRLTVMVSEACAQCFTDAMIQYDSLEAVATADVRKQWTVQPCGPLL
jgi:hypothetical protein